LHNEKLHNLYSSSNIIRARDVARMAQINTYIDFIGKSEGKRPLGTTNADVRIVLKRIL
jgi:hypothetical protein